MQTLSDAFSSFRDALTNALDTFEDNLNDAADSEAEAPGQVTQAVTAGSSTITQAQGRTRGGVLHLQWRMSGQSNCDKADVAIPDSFHFPEGTAPSMAGSSTKYVPLAVSGNQLSYNGFNLFTVDGAGGGANPAPNSLTAKPVAAPTPAALAVTSAQVAVRGSEAHIQFRVAGESGYRTSNVQLSNLSDADRSAINKQATLPSMAGTQRRYAPMAAVTTEDGVSLNISGVTLAVVK